MQQEDKVSTIYKIAISMTKGVNADVVNRIHESGLSLKDFFEIDSTSLCDALSLPRNKLIQKSTREEALLKAHHEYDFICKHGIKTLYLGDRDTYPYRLAECHDAPTMLYMLGNANLNCDKIFSLVGTRKATPYGANFCKTIIKDLKDRLMDFTVVSGLAYGIDVFAHTACLDEKLPTVAVLAHGLNMIYPSAHRSIAETIIKSGGALVTEYNSQQKPHRSNFLERNRIVAGLCDATIVVESDIKGGAMSTAQLAFGYNREVMAVPGRITDQMSHGCNHLIRRNKAYLIESAADIMEIMNWSIPDIKIDARQRCFFPDMTIEEELIYNFISKSQNEVSIDEIHKHLGTPIHQLMPTLIEMEFNGIIIKYPGNRYGLSI